MNKYDSITRILNLAYCNRSVFLLFKTQLNSYYNDFNSLLLKYLILKYHEKLSLIQDSSKTKIT